MPDLFVYIASRREFTTRGGASIELPDQALASGAGIEQFVSRRFELAVNRWVDTEARLVVVLRDVAGLDDEAGTAIFAPVFNVWSKLHGREVELLELRSTRDAVGFYDAFEQQVDRWLDEADASKRDGTQQAMHVYLAGDSTVDVIAAISCLHGARHASNVNVYRHITTGFAEERFEELGIRARIGEELTREHALERIRRWEFEEVRALARIHVRDFQDVAPLLEAVGSYIQRNPVPLTELGFVDAELPVEWEYTADLCHALEIAEYFATVGRFEEEVAWYVVLAVNELAPMAWAEGYMWRHFGERLTLEAGLERFETVMPDFRAAGTRLLRPFGAVDDSAPSAGPLQLLASVGAKALSRRGGEGADAGGAIARSKLPEDVAEAARPHLVWLALRAALRKQRNDLAHSFKDLDQSNLGRWFDESGAAALDHARQLIAVDAAQFAPVRAMERRRRTVLLAGRGQPERPAPPARGAARRHYNALVAGEELDLDQISQDLYHWLKDGHHDLDDFLAWCISKVRQAAPHVAAELEERTEALEVDEPTAEEAAQLRREVEDVLGSNVLQPTPLNVADRDSAMWRLVGVFSPEAQRRPNPLIAARASLMESLRQPSHNHDGQIHGTGSVA